MGKIVISKYDKTSEGGTPIEGVEFGLYKDGVLIGKTVKPDRNGVAVFKGVKPEDGIVVREVATVKGYSLNKVETKVDFTPDEINITYTNYKAIQDLPETGTLGKLPYLALGLSLVAVAMFLKKRKEQNN